MGLSRVLQCGWRLVFCGTQRTQCPVIKEYTLNHNIKAPIILGIFLNYGILSSLGIVCRAWFTASGSVFRVQDLYTSFRS